MRFILTLKLAQAAVILISAAATGGMATSTVEMMPMSEYASAQKGSASGSLHTQANHEQTSH